MDSPADKPYGCDWCSVRFTRKEHKTRHEASHDPRRHYSCSLCPRSFLRKDILLRHEKSVHGATASSSRARQRERASNVDSSQKSEAESDPNAGAIAQGIDSLGISSSSYNPMIHSEPITSGLMSDSVLDSSLNLFPFGVGDVDAFLDIPPPLPPMGYMGTQGNTPLHTSATDTSADATAELIDFFDESKESIASPPGLSSVDDGVMEGLRTSVCQSIVLEPGGIPSKMNMKRFLRSYFTFFHPHAPILHLPTFIVSHCSQPLLLVVCAIGALYSFDRADAQRLYEIARELYGTQRSELQQHRRIQTLLLLAMYGSWSGDEKLWNESTAIQNQLAREIRLLRPGLSSSGCLSFQVWLEHEELKRLIYHVMCYLGSLKASFFATPLPLERDLFIELPCCESVWRCATAEQWMVAKNQVFTPPLFHDVFRNLFSPSTQPTVPLGPLALAALLVQLHIHICKCKAIAAIAPSNVSAEWLDSCTMAMNRWVDLLKYSRKDSACPADGSSSITVWSLLFWKVTYVQLHVDDHALNSSKVAAMRAVMALKDDPYELLQRGPEVTNAMRHALMFLRGPISQGLQFIIKTGALDNNVWQGLLGFHCIVLLARWLYTMEFAEKCDVTPSPSEDEQTVVDATRSILAESNLPSLEGLPLSKACAQVWIEVLTFHDNYVWGVAEVLGKSLKVFNLEA